MEFEITTEKYAGNIKSITLGKGDNSIVVGGQTSYPFHLFEGQISNKPVIAMEIWDIEPEDWPLASLAPFKDVISDPAAWAKKCVNDYGAQIIVLQLKSIDPNDKNASADDAVASVKKVLKVIDVPLIVWGCAAFAKDEEVLKKICEECEGENLIIGPVEEKNYKGIGAAAMGYGHVVIASSPIDVNLAKQINILLENLGVSLDRVVVDPTTGGLGYGLEYSYSVMERLFQAAISQGDDKLQNPMINNLGNEVWKCKEAKLTVDEAPELGDPERRAILMEAVGAVSYLLAGSSILIMRHPESIKLVNAFIDLLINDGSAMDIPCITKKLDDVKIDYSALSFDMDLTIEKDKKPISKPVQVKSEPKKSATPIKPIAKVVKQETPKQEIKKEQKEEQIKKEQSLKEAKEKLKKEAIEKAEQEANDKIKQEAKAKQEAKEKAKQDAKEKALQEEKEQAAKREAYEEELKEKRAAQMASHASKPKVSFESKTTIAKVQKTMLEKIIENLDWIHKRK